MITKNDKFYDRNGKEFKNGQTIRVQECIGPYGQVAQFTAKILDVHHPDAAYLTRLLLLTERRPSVRSTGSSRPAGTEIAAELTDWNGSIYKAYHRNNDYDHNHETWAEILKEAPAPTAEEVKTRAKAAAAALAGWTAAEEKAMRKATKGKSICELVVLGSLNKNIHMAVLPIQEMLKIEGDGAALAFSDLDDEGVTWAQLSCPARYNRLAEWLASEIPNANK